MRHLKIIRADDGFATLVMDNADESMNLVSDAFIAEMCESIAQIAADETIKGVILTSGKPAFMAGADLKQLVQGHPTLTLKQAFDFSQKASGMHRAIETCGKPWVAVINGLALGGGFELALACHYRVLIDDPRAVVGLPEVNVGLLPGSGGTQRMLRLAGVQASMDLLLSGRAVAGSEALKLGIIDAVVAADRMEGTARAWLATSPDPVKPWDVKGYAIPEARGLIVPEYSSSMMFAAGSITKAGYNMPAPVAILSCIYEGSILPFDKALSVESKYFAKLLTSPVSRNIIRTTFLSKGAAERGARRPKGIAKTEFSKIGVLGAGMMGAGIALVSAQAGCDVILIDRDVETATKGKAYSQTALGKLVARGSMTQDKADAALARITPTDDFAHLAGCDLIIEAVFEDIAIKAETTRKAEAVMPSTAVYASNTSTLPITGLAEASARPDQFIGLHFFSPVERMGLVEIIKGEKTSPATLAVALDFVAKLRKTPIVVNDSRGFYTSRVFQTFIHEGAAMLAEGVPPAVIENTAKAVGMPVGPLALLDELTFDLPLKIVDQAIEQVGDSYVLPAGVGVLRTMKQHGRSGKKAAAGFYDYPVEGGKHLWKGLAEIFPVSPGYDVEQLKQRFLYAQAIETARCLEENVIETSEDGDLGAVYGWGFPAWTGGTLSYIDTVGTATFVRECDRLAQKLGPRFAPSAWLRARAASGQGFY
ncbi:MULTISPECIES: 3-hydroxyacyl-CoA dehydrogenase NAD-binding domain-containing protein [Pseudomonadota]|jgi:3-hydroxyacyl-CoA dehydrogenase/enoyl-CoA hydratase/3-hydroxybutyryl-CoA epimerase|uniref:3-hydroxyacyl-CoA dehydrogenase NAD-binding domain-containing protein n=1 Tax=Pseudomonadota TaxID=1224 RepID=UPI000769E756|nr:MULTISPECIES: 3-hydroxyacyl-CoA dehydrogenase NAD-binding domain-containing protein [Pseudomonadota]